MVSYQLKTLNSSIPFDQIEFEETYGIFEFCLNILLPISSEEYKLMVDDISMEECRILY